MVGYHCGACGREWGKRRTFEEVFDAREVANRELSYDRTIIVNPYIANANVEKDK